MKLWRPRQYQSEGVRRGIDQTVLEHAVATGRQIIGGNAELPPIFSLRHLAYIADGDYGLLRKIISRELDPYKVFAIRKRSGRVAGKKTFRIICVPSTDLMKTQRFINSHILAHGSPHPASAAYCHGSSIRKAADPHCLCQWLIKLDIQNFFESVSELAVYRVFRGLGYQPLVCFEMARLCTRLGSFTHFRGRPRWFSNSRKYSVIRPYQCDRMGHLPQGAPTSPMLANLALNGFDAKVAAIAKRHDLVYTRYADDLSFSSADRSFGRHRVGKLISDVYATMRKVGLSPNTSKAHISPPGARKILLGLLVDGRSPRLPRDFKAMMRQHLYYLQNYGPVEHARRRKFAAVAGLRHHIEGLVAFARDIDPEYADSYKKELTSITWPL
jgi:RNA-directed DNA polymerase